MNFQSGWHGIFKSKYVISLVKFEFKEDGILKTLQFEIKFITPLLMGGAENHVDKNGLSGKALRGCWRFWFRAMIGGMIKDFTKENLLSHESKIFGSADNTIGSKFRLNLKKNDEYKPESFLLGFRRKDREIPKDGFSEGSLYSITIIPRQNMSEDEINILIATIWLWGNLGAVGNRERRGFGSPKIFLKPGIDNPFSFDINESKIILPVKDEDQSFENLVEMKAHLINGIKSVWAIYKKWINTENIKKIEENIETLSSPANASYFILRSLEQISVGDKSYSNRDNAIRAVHGSSRCDELGWVDRRERMASPVFIRFHYLGKKNEEEYLPIFTWCKQKNVPNDNNCARDYLTNISIGQRKVFTENLMGQKL